MKGSTFIIICIVLAVIGYFVYGLMWQVAPPEPLHRDGNGLFPGEINDPNWPVPIIAWVADSTCSDSTKCPPTGEGCGFKNFVVQKDTTYFLTVSYFNRDTLNPSCRTCGTVYGDHKVVANLVTACPTGGEWVTVMRLVPGVTYTVEACLQTCPNVPGCKCGERVQADAVVSMRRLF
ncbi:MAG: hypothetical protein IPP40_15455 [bacterium]|nr:hypothetical protein [bacterium]